MRIRERWEELKKKEDVLKRAAASISVQEKDLTRVIQRFKKELDEMNDELSNFSD